MRPIAHFPSAFLRLLLVAAVLGGLFAPTAAAGAPRATEASAEVHRQIDELFTTWNRWDSPGASLAVVRDGEIVYRRGYGSAHLEYGIAITPRTPFHVASVSKQFTSFAIALLAADGKLSLDDDVRQHVPEVPDFGHTLTLRHLAQHTSGIRDQWELLAMAGWRLDDVITKDQILEMVRHQRELNFEPGAEYLYSNTGYTLLAEVVARVSGQSFPDFCRERIFAPLGMSRTHFHDSHEHIVPGRAYSYSPQGDGFRKAVLSYANAGATSLFTTAEDLARWLHNLETAEVGGSEVREMMLQRGVLNDGKEIDYALGISHGKYRGLATLSHSGGDAGFRSIVTYFPEHRLGVVVLSNLASFSAGEIGGKVATVFLEEHMEPLEEEAASDVESAERVELDSEVLDRYVGSYRLDIGALVTISRRGRRLLTEVPGADQSELVPFSETDFLIAELGARLRFDPFDGDSAQSFVVEAQGQKFTGERVQPLPGAALDPFVGIYASSELGTVYTLIRDGDRLVARHRRHPPITLIPVSETEMLGDQWWLSSMKFEGGDDGEIRAFRATGSRVRNLLFERIDGAAAKALAVR